MHDPIYCKFSPFPLPNCGTPHLAPSPPRVSEHSAVPKSYGVHSCALFMVRFSRYVRYWSSMIDKKRQYVQALSDTTMGLPRPRTLAFLLMWSRCSPLSLPTGVDQRCTKENHKILLQFNLHKLYNLCKIICN